ncbi:MAG: iron dicitrate transport regulator FecR [Hydrogenophaga sp.]
MTTHQILGRTEDELLWFTRRQSLKAAAAWVALGGLPAALAQQRTNVVEFVGDILLNGGRMLPGQLVQTGDEVVTGPASRLVFVIGNAAFHVRQNSRLRVERGGSLNTVSLLRLISGAVGSVFGPARSRAIVTPTLTAGIRGTGVYTEVMPDGRSYFCNCYGVVDLAAGSTRLVSDARYHQSFWAAPEAQQGRYISVADPYNHTDEELEFLARLVDQRTAWQVAGRKGVMDGRGFLDPQPPEAHPAAPR